MFDMQLVKKGEKVYKRMEEAKKHPVKEKIIVGGKEIEVERVGEFTESDEIAYREYFNWKYLNSITESAQKEDWEGVTTAAVLSDSPRIKDFVMWRYYDRIPDSMKYDFVMQMYIHIGDSIPSVRQALRGLRKYRTDPCLPDDVRNLPELTVYRAGEEPLEKARYRLSWTLSESVARFFLDEYRRKHAKYLYRAKIKPEKVIAYTNDREEEEVIQYRNVYDIEVIDTAKK